MLGVKDRQTLEHKTDAESVSGILDDLERSDYERLGGQAKRALEAFK